MKGRLTGPTVFISRCHSGVGLLNPQLYRARHEPVLMSEHAVVIGLDPLSD